MYTEPNGILYVLFSDGKYRKFCISVLFDDYPEFNVLKDNALFCKCKLLANYIVKWNDELDLIADTIYDLSEPVKLNISPAVALLGYQLKKTRISKNMSQKELSKLTGIDQSEISKIETGCNNPSIEYIEKITKALGKQLVLKIKSK